MKRGARGPRMHERRMLRRLCELENRRDRQSRRRRSHGRAHQGNDRADRAEIIRVMIRIWILRRKLLLGGLYRRCRLRRDRMDVTERQRKLDGDRKQREPCSKLDVRPDPLHAENAPHAGTKHPVRFRCYNITSQVPRLYVNCSRQKLFVSLARRWRSNPGGVISVLRAPRWQRMRRAAAAGRSSRRRPAGRRHP